MTWTKVERGIVMRDGVYYVRFQVNGKTVTEATEARSVVQARAERAIRQGRVHDGRHVESRRKRVTISDLLDALLKSWKTTGDGGGPIRTYFQRSQKLEIVRRGFGHRKAIEWTYRDSVDFVAGGKTPAQRGTRSSHMSLLKSAFNVGVQEGLVRTSPQFAPRIDNVRQGFIEPEDFEALVTAFSGVDAQILIFAYRTGQRIQRVLDMHVTDVDTVDWLVRAEPSRGTKQRPMVPLIGAARIVAEDRVKAASGPTWLLFHRNGRRISRHSIHHKWKKLMKEKGLPWTIHDFRRSCARNLVNSGVDSSLAMRITGHESLSMFTRYAIQPNEAIKRAAIQLDSYIKDRLAASAQPSHSDDVKPQQ